MPLRGVFSFPQPQMVTTIILIPVCKINPSFSPIATPLGTSHRSTKAVAAAVLIRARVRVDLTNRAETDGIKLRVDAKG